MLLWLHFIWLVCWALAGTAGADEASTASVTLLVQLTDLHVSRFQHLDKLTSTYRVEDLEVFGDSLLRLWKPEGIVITGDLTDAKSPSGRGEQYKAEWREYRRLWRRLVEAAGLEESALLDLRGNHDVFDNIRGGIHDYYPSFSARAARSKGQPQSSGFTRIYVDTFHPTQAWARGQAMTSAKRRTLQHKGAMEDVAAPSSSMQSSTAGSAAGKTSKPTHLLHSRRLLQRALSNPASAGAMRDGSSSNREVGGHLAPRQAQQLQAIVPRPGERGLQGASSTWASGEQAGRRAQQPAAAQCPSVVMLGVDATPNPGLRNPTNFLGIVGPDLLAELHNQLAQVQLSARAAMCQPPVIIAYGHHTLSTLAYSDEPVQGYARLRVHGGCGNATGTACPQDEAAGGAQGAAGQAQEQPAEQGTAGLPHSRAQVPESRVEQVLGAWDVAAYLCGHLHDTFGLRVHRMHSKDSMADGSLGTGGHMAELLLPDWKLQRWFRLITVDPQAGMAFTDLQFLRDLNDQGDQEEPVELQPADSSRVVGRNVVLITSPADSRYSYLASHPGTPGSAVAASSMVRVLLLPTQPSELTERSKRLVLLMWSCDVGGLLGREKGSLPMTPAPHQPWVYEADLERVSALAACSGGLTIQVLVPEGSSSESRSELRPVRLPTLVSRIRQLHATATARAAASEPAPTLTMGEAVAAAVQQAASGLAAGAATAGGVDPSASASATWALAASLAAPDPLKLRLSEQIILNVPWPEFGVCAFHLQWCLLVVVFLLVPRLFGQLIVVIHSALHNLCFGSHVVWAVRQREPALASHSSGSLPATLPLMTMGSGQLSSQAAAPGLGHRESHTRESLSGGHTQSPMSASHSHGLSTSLGAGALSLAGPSLGMVGPAMSSSRLCALLGHARCAVRAVVAPVAWTSRHCVARPVALLMLCGLWPLVDLARVATQYQDLWWCLLAYALNLQFGPWLVGVFGSTIAGWGVLTAHGIWLPGPSGYRYHVLHDVPIITNVHMATAILPAVLWLASVVSYWSDLAASNRLSVSRLLTWKQILALLLLLPLHCRLQAKIAVFYGAPAVLLAPCTGWLIPLAAVWLRYARNRVNKSRLD